MNDTAERPQLASVDFEKDDDPRLGDDLFYTVLLDGKPSNWFLSRPEEIGEWSLYNVEDRRDVIDLGDLSVAAAKEAAVEHLYNLEELWA